MNKKKILKDAIYAFGENNQIDMAIEEMAELTKALLKHRRAVDSNNKQAIEYALENIAEEIGDVRIMLKQLVMIFDNKKKVNEHIEMSLVDLQQKINEYVDRCNRGTN